MSEAIIESHRGAVAVGLAALVGALSAAGLVAQDRGLQPVLVAQKRALLIGNARYVHTAPLVNTIPDVRALESALEEVGFDSVTRLEDQSLREMVRAVGEFAGSLRAGDLAFFYYSGHGLRVTNESHQSESYLLPVDYERTVASEVPFTALPAKRVQARLESTGARVRVIVLDACRNNPFGGGRSAAEGLAAMEAKAEGTLIAYSAGAGQVASDNPGGGLGLYMTHLLPELRQPTVDLWGAFKSTQARVWEASGKKQLPELYDSVVGGKVYLREVPGGDAPEARLAEGKCEGYWEDVRGSEDPGEYEWYLEQCPEGAYSGLAERRLARLRQPPAPPASLEDPPGRTGPPTETEKSVHRIGGGVASPIVIYKVEPEYSVEARKAGIEGMVLLAVEVWQDGRAHNIRVLRSVTYGLDEKAIEAVEKWRFNPGRKDGEPVRTAAQIQVHFKLSEDSKR